MKPFWWWSSVCAISHRVCQWSGTVVSVCFCSLSTLGRILDAVQTNIVWVRFIWSVYPSSVPHCTPQSFYRSGLWFLHLLLWDGELFIISNSHGTVQDNEYNISQFRLTILDVEFSLSSLPSSDVSSINSQWSLVKEGNQSTDFTLFYTD